MCSFHQLPTDIRPPSSPMNLPRPFTVAPNAYGSQKSGLIRMPTEKSVRMSENWNDFNWCPFVIITTWFTKFKGQNDFGAKNYIEKIISHRDRIYFTVKHDL